MSEYTGPGADRGSTRPQLQLAAPPGDQEFGPPKYGSAWDAALGHELASYMGWKMPELPAMNQLVPGYEPDESTVQKMMDFGSLPARIAAAPLVMGGEAWKRWMSGDQGPETRQMMLESLVGTGFLASGVARPAGSLGVFGGERAATADLDRLKLAKHMEAGKHEVSMDGKTWQLASTPMQPREIWQHTGWFRDVDNRWKFEIPDTAASWKDPAEFGGSISAAGNLHMPWIGGKPTTLGQALEHPELFQAYPELAATPLHSTGMMAPFSGVKGAVYKGGNIGLTSGPPAEMLSTGLHEVQHKIQDVEGFARGGNLDEFLPDGFQTKFADAAENLERSRGILRNFGLNSMTVENGLKREAAGETMPGYVADELAKARQNVGPKVVDLFRDRVNVYDGLAAQQNQAFNSYQHLAGEIESRNVQERLAQGDYTSHPRETQGYPTGVPIVRFKTPGSNFVQESFGAWHGSPHLFEPQPEAPLGAFKPIEEVAYTGEGTQAFAYGHYIAGKRQTSEGYMQPTGSVNRIGTYLLDGKPVKPIDYLDTNNAAYVGFNHLGYNDGNHAAAIKDIQGEARNMYKLAQEHPAGSEERKVLLMQAKEFLDGGKWIEANKDRIGYTPPPPADPGHLYQVAVRPNEHQLLDWDRPISSQSSEVQAKVTPLFTEPHMSQIGLQHPGFNNGQDLYQALAKHSSPEEASKWLHDLGIPGVRFQDARSRGLPPGHPDETHNYVIFHHSNLRVIDRDGKHFGLEPVEGDPWAVVPQP